MKITLLTIGRNADTELDRLIARYESRLSHYTRYETRCLRDVKTGRNTTPDMQKSLEGRVILDALPQSATVVLLDERGRQYTSRAFAEYLDALNNRAVRDLYFVVGGPYGFSQDVYRRADSLMSLSAMTMTHEMIRLFFTEQLYRAHTILRGENYHHD